MSDRKSPSQRPIWVQLGLFGLSTRASAWAFFWISILLAIASVAYGIIADPKFIAGGLLVFASLWYYAAIRWVDRHGAWS